ncbi:MAG: putative toxin-antitoxin system toxin component, PIN family [Patescibacteria group bacterium]
MKTPLLVVLDTNVLISSFLTPGNSRKIVDLAARRKILVFSSSQLEEELRRTLKDKLKYETDELSQALITYKEIVHKFVYPKKKLKVITQDETDNRIIEAAIEGRVGYMVTGDKHLLNLGKYKDITILNPADFVSRYREKI